VGSDVDDPNADLVGKTLPLGRHMFTILETWNLNPQYLIIKSSLVTTVRPVAQVRRHLELTT
jgi:hypothetical protein